MKNIGKKRKSIENKKIGTRKLLKTRPHQIHKVMLTVDQDLYVYEKGLSTGPSVICVI
jgi:hypothetical protein